MDDLGVPPLQETPKWAIYTQAILNNQREYLQVRKPFEMCWCRDSPRQGDFALGPFTTPEEKVPFST